MEFYNTLYSYTHYYHCVEEDVISKWEEVALCLMLGSDELGILCLSAVRRWPFSCDHWDWLPTRCPSTINAIFEGQCIGRHWGAMCISNCRYHWRILPAPPRTELTIKDSSKSIAYRCLRPKHSKKKKRIEATYLIQCSLWVTPDNKIISNRS